MRERTRERKESAREREGGGVKVVCHSARISSENYFTVANYVNHRHNSITLKLKKNWSSSCYIYEFVMFNQS